MLAVAALGVILGLIGARSFVAEVDAHRLRGEDRWWDPRCPECAAPLGVLLVRCREGHRQRFINVMILVLLPVLLASAAYWVPSLWLWPAYAVFVASMLLLSVADLDTKLIPNRILGPATLVGAVLLVGGWIFDMDAGSLLRALLGALAYFFVMYLLAVIARGALGFGDVKLAFLIGGFAGFISWGSVLVAGIGGFLIGGIVSVALLVSGKFGRKDSIPFGPFMAIGGVIAVVWGTAIMEWYLG